MNEMLKLIINLLYWFKINIQLFCHLYNLIIFNFNQKMDDTNHEIGELIYGDSNAIEEFKNSYLDIEESKIQEPTNEEVEFYKKVDLCSTRICCATILNAQRRIKSLNRSINKETDDLRLRNKLRMKTMLANRLERLKHKLRNYENRLASYI